VPLPVNKQLNALWNQSKQFPSVHRKKFARLTALLLGLLFTAACASNATMRGDVLDAETSLETFDQVWNQVRTQYFDYPRIEQDWLTTRDELRPRAAAAKTAAELRSLLNEMLDRVGESHFAVLPPTGVSAGRSDDETVTIDVPNVASGLGVRLINDALIFDRVGEWNSDLIEPGWELTAIGKQRIDSLIEETLNTDDPVARERAELYLEASANGRIGFPQKGEELRLTVRNAAGVERTIQARTGSDEVSIFQIGNLPGLPFSYQAEIIDSGFDSGSNSQKNCIGRMTFSTWVPDLMDRFMESRESLFACQGLVIDLRGNLGGVLTTMMPLSGHLFDEMILLGQLKRNDGRIDFRAFPRRVAVDGTRLTPYDGPVAILIDSLSASTSEMFTSGLQAQGRARVFGTQSPGMALPAQILPLANGDRLMYAFADYIDGEGRRIEGIGVVPDEVIEPTRESVSSGRDAVLESAIRWIRSESRTAR